MPSRAAILKDIQDEWERETGERPGRAAADVLFDRMANAFNEAIAGVGYDFAVREHTRMADYFRNWWVGAEYREQGSALRAAWKRYQAELNGETSQADEALAIITAPAEEQTAVVEEPAAVEAPARGARKAPRRTRKAKQDA